MAVALDRRRARSAVRRRGSAAVPLALVLIALVSTALACGGDDAGSSAPNTLHMRYVAKMVRCRTPEAVEDPDVPGQCIVLGDSLFGPSDFTKPVVKDDAALGSGVGVTLTSNARNVFLRNFETIAPNSLTAPGGRLMFVFDGRPLRWTLLPGPDANLLVVTGDKGLAGRIVASLHGQ